MRGASFAAAVALLAGVAGCATGDAGPTDGRLRVVAAFYPLAFLAERVGGDAVAVSDLTPAGAEPHDLELTARRLAAVRGADVLLYLRGFQPAVDDAASGSRALDLSAVTPYERADPAVAGEGGGRDPHVWLDPVRMATMAAAVTERLAAGSPGRAGEIRRRGEALAAELRALDAELRARLGDCERRDLVTSHAAFGYLARRYGLRQVGIAGVSPDEEPTGRRMAEVARFVRERRVTTIFFETLVSPRLAATIARETGARTAVLDPIEGRPAGPDDDYLDVMRANARAVATALGCR